jgi:hypothetical protein
MTTDIPSQITTPDSLDTSIGTLSFFDGVPDNATVSTVYDYVDRARGWCQTNSNPSPQGQ